ncbi:MAG: hypothetical protein Q7J84_04010 [Sulfuricaulis sp.]|nr:hypothetical protein [Sulfuricaulis sp.]
MTNPDALSILVGIGMPALVSWLKECDWPDKWKRILAGVVSLGLGFATSYFAGGLVLDWNHALIDTAIVFIAGQATYRLWFRNTEVNAQLEVS